MCRPEGVQGNRDGRAVFARLHSPLARQRADAVRDQNATVGHQCLPLSPSNACLSPTLHEVMLPFWTGIDGMLPILALRSTETIMPSKVEPMARTGIDLSTGAKGVLGA